MKIGPQLIGALEEIYAIDGDVRGWLRGVVGATSPILDQGLGVFGATYDATDHERFRLSSIVGGGLPVSGWPALMKQWAATTPPAAIDKTFGQVVVGTFSEALGPAFMDGNVIARAAAMLGLADAIGVNAGDPTGRGYALCAPLPARTALPGDVVESMSFLAAHIASAGRLRRAIAKTARGAARRAAGDARPALDEVEETAEAILAPDGALLHATEATEGAAERSVLRAAALAMDRARGKLRRTAPAEALATWQALVGGRWSLVDFFDRDGRRFLVAEKADPDPPELAALTRRERQIAAYAALGHGNKLIAYELGISPSTVSTHLSVAMSKLAATSRVDLVRAIRRARLRPSTSCA